MYATLYAILNKSESATLQCSIFCEKVLDEKYLLKLNNVFQTSSKRLVETPPRISSDKASNLPKRDVCFILLK